jgi:hypothetical protein
MRPRADIPPDSLWQIDWPHVIQEDEGTDHVPLCEGQYPPHFERTDAAPTFLYHQLDHVARSCFSHANATPLIIVGSWLWTFAN